MKPEITKEEEIIQATGEVRQALLNDLRTNLKVEEINREKTATRYTLQKAKERLLMINY